MREKRCSRCKEVKPLHDFYRRVDGSARGPCKDCWLADQRTPAKRALNAASKRRASLRANYGMTEEDYCRMFLEQQGKCAVCGLEEQTRHRTGTGFSLSLDHDHDTGRVRGLLCQRCNRAIGLLGDDVALLRQAINYLMRSCIVEVRKVG